jgi:hypothetical protein
MYVHVCICVVHNLFSTYRYCVVCVCVYYCRHTTILCITMYVYYSLCVRVCLHVLYTTVCVYLYV